MGWEMYDASKPKMYDYFPSSNRYVYGPDENPTSGLPYWNWAAWTVWTKSEAAIRYINTSSQPLTFSQMNIRILACNSGGQGFWSNTGWIPRPGSNGYGATYTIKTFVCNTPGAKDLPCSAWSSLQFQEGTPAVNKLPPDGYNMNYTGVNHQNCAQFGEYPYQFPMRQFPLQNVPTILPGGFIIFRLGVKDRTGQQSSWDPTIRFAMNPIEMEVKIEPKFNPYIWRAYRENGKVAWHLVKPIQIKASDKWHNIEGDGK